MGGARRDVTAVIRDRVVTGVLPPGAHLTEAALATEHRVSRSPVRAALRVLAAEGLVTIEPHRGAFVAEWTAADAREVMEIRALLEPHAARLAARRRTEEDVAGMRALCARMEAARDRRDEQHRGAIAELNHELHLAVIRAAASPRLYNIAKDLALAPIMSGSFHYYSEEQLARSLDEHRGIVDALGHRDADRAGALVEAHLRNAYAALSHRP